MSEQMHTEGKLEARGSIVLFDNCAGGFCIRNCPSPEANAKRIAACWNACDGIDIKYLESTDNLATYARKMMLQRDNLLEALQGLLNALPSATTHPAIKAARKAIAEVEESK